MPFASVAMGGAFDARFNEKKAAILALEQKTAYTKTETVTAATTTPIEYNYGEPHKYTVNQDYSSADALLSIAEQ